MPPVASSFTPFDPTTVGVPQGAPAADQVEAPGEFTKGIRRGGNRLVSALHTLAGTVGQAAGVPDSFNQGQMQDATASTAAANDPSLAAAVPSYKDVNSLRTAGQYAAGQAGELIPQAIPAVVAGGAASLATGGAAIPALAAATLAGAPQAVGENLEAQNADPVQAAQPIGKRLAVAGASGLAQSALQNVVPGRLGGSLLGKAAEGGIIRTAGIDAAEQAGAGAASSVVGQGAAAGLNPNHDTSHDTQDTIDSAVGGGLLGAGIGGIRGAAGHLTTTTLPGRALDAAKQAAGTLADKVVPPKLDAAPETTGVPVGDSTSSVSDLFSTVKDKVGDIARRVAAGSDAHLGEPLPEGASPEQAEQHIADSDQAKTTWSLQTAKDLIANGGLTDDQKAKVSAALQNITDPVAQATVAGIKLATDAASKATSAIGNAWFDLKRGASNLGKDTSTDIEGETREVPDVPALQSSVVGGTNKAISTIAQPYLDAAGVKSTPETASRNADVLRTALAEGARTGSIDKGLLANLRNIYGDKTHALLSDLHQVISGASAQADEKYSAMLNRVAENDKLYQGARKILTDNLNPAFAHDVTPEILDQTTRAISAHVNEIPRGGPEEVKANETKFQASMQEAFGSNAKKVLDHFTKLGDEIDATHTGDIARFTGDKGETPPHEEAAASSQLDEASTIYRDRRGPYLHPDEALKTFGNEGLGGDYRARALKENPDRNVRFAGGAEYDEMHGNPKETTPETRGAYVAEGEKNPGKLTTADIDTLAPGPKASPKSVIDTGALGVKIDARALTAHMDRVMNKDVTSPGDEVSRTVRLARSFMDGIAAVQETLGRKFEIPPDTEIGGTKRSPILYSDIEKMDLKQGRDAADDAHTRELNAARKAGDDERVAKLEGEKENKVAGEQNVRDDQEASIGMTTGDEAKEPEAARTTPLGGAEPLFGSKPNENAPKAEVGAKINEPVMKDGNITENGMRAIDSVASRLESATRKAGSKEFEHTPARKLAALVRSLAGRVDEMNTAQRKLFAGIAEMATKENPGGIKPSVIAEKVNYIANKLGPEKVKAEPKGAPPSPKPLAAEKAAFLAKARSSDPALHEAIGKSTDVAALQRSVDFLNEHGGAEATIDKVNDRISKLMEADPENVSLSMQKVDPTASIDPKTQQAVRDYIEKVIGPKVQVLFEKLLNAAGDFKADPMPTVRVSVHALNPMGTAFHESLHAWFDDMRKSGNFDSMKVIFKAADSERVRAQLREFLKDEPEALKQVEEHAEERAAYMYQMHALGLLDLSPNARGIFNKLRELFKQVTGIWTNDERAVHIMDHFQQGDYAKNINNGNTLARIFTKPGTNEAWEKTKTFAAPLARLADAVVSAGDARLRSVGNPALNKLADLIHPTTVGKTSDPGFISSSREERTIRMNALWQKLAGVSQAHLNDALNALQRGDITKATTPEGRLAYRTVRDWLDDMHDYMTKAGVQLGDLGVGKDYFPRVWDTSYISGHQADFLTMLDKYVRNGTLAGDPKEILRRLVAADGNEFRIETGRPGMQSAKERVLSMISGDDAAQFARKNIFEITNSYATQAARRAEWARRFGDDNSKLNKLLDGARKNGASSEDIKMAEKYIKAVNGTLGDNIDPGLRKAFGNMIVYQNIRLLPLAIFSSVVDPVGLVVNGATAREGFNAFLKGVKEIKYNFTKDPARGADYKLAEDLGVIDNHVLTQTIGASYSQGMVGDTGKRFNDMFFKYNLMEQFNMSMRVAGTQAALQFIGKHADGVSKHSERWLAELGLKAGDVKKDAQGNVKTSQADDLTTEQVALMRNAVNKWVDGAVLRPNAAHKPVWQNDPHFALVSHLKQFVYSFQQTIIKRVVHEAQHANYSPALALASYVPIMIAADAAKGILTSGGTPDWKADWGLSDYLFNGMERAGLFGVGQFGIDALKDLHRGGNGLGSLTGPTIEQLGDAAKTVGGHEQFGTFALHSLPANALYSGVIKGGARADPTFND